MDLTDDEVHQRAEADRKSVQIDQADRAASRTYRLYGGSFERPCCETTPTDRSARDFLTVVRRNDPSSDHAAVRVRAACGTRVQHFTGGSLRHELVEGWPVVAAIALHELAIAASHLHPLGAAKRECTTWPPNAGPRTGPWHPGTAYCGQSLLVARAPMRRWYAPSVLALAGAPRCWYTPARSLPRLPSPCVLLFRWETGPAQSSTDTSQSVLSKKVQHTSRAAESSACTRIKIVMWCRSAR
jgi:hypothetical protein